MEQQQETTETKQYETSDFLTAAYLVAKDQAIRDAKRNGKRVVFEFNDKEHCNDLAKNLLMGNDTVSATVLFNAIKRLKKIIYSG